MNINNSISIMTPYPVSVNRYYRTYRNITTISREGRQFKQQVQQNYKHLNPIDNNVALDIIIHPKQKQNGEAYKKIIDLDNGLKCILDSLIGVIYHDDKQVKELNVIYGEPMPNEATSINAVKL